MNQWVERFENHSFHTNLEALEASLDKCEELQLEPDELLAVERIKQILGLLKTRIQLVDPALTVEGTLKNIDSQLSKANSEVSQFVSSRRIRNINAANSHADGLLVQISNIPTIQNVDDVAEVRDAVSSLRMAVGQYMHHLQKEKDEIKAEIDDLFQRAEEIRGQVEHQKKRVDNTISQFQEQFSDAQSKRQERSAQAQRDRDQQFTSTVEAIKDESSELLEVKEQSLDELLDTLRKEIEESRDQIIQETEVLLENIEGQKDKAGELVNIIANTGMIGGFQKEADSEKRSYLIWSVFAVLCFIGLIAFAIWAFAGAEENGVNITMIGSRIFAATAFGVLAAYAARQADKHRKAERRNRRLQLEIAAIGPYLNDLPEGMRNEVRREIADRVFGRFDDVNGEQESVPATSLYDLLKRAIDGMANG